MKQHFAAGDFITRKDDGELLIETPVEKPGWKARDPGGVTHAVFPGSAIHFEDRYYEILQIEKLPGQEARYQYSLRPWEETFPIRVQFAYTAEECRRITAEKKQERQNSSTVTLLNLFAPLVGLLPGADQKRLESNYGLMALRTTLISSVFTFIAGIAAILWSMSAMMTNDTLPFNFPPVVLSILGLWLTCESVFRFFSCKHDEPMGSFLVALPLGLFRGIRMNFDPAYKKRRFETMDSGAAAKFLNARDEVLPLEDGDYEVISMLPKPEWSAVLGIQFNGNWYNCVDSGPVQRGTETMYRYHLREVAAGYAFRTTTLYTTDEIRKRYLEKRNVELRTWVETFAPFWGLLPGEDQRRLEKLYGFVPLKYTAWTIGIIGTIAAFNIVVSVMNFSAHIATAADAIWLLAAGALMIETASRLREWLRNQPSGSMLGLPLRWLATSLLRGY